VADSLMRIHENKAEFREGGYEDNQAWVDLDLKADAQEEPQTQKTKATGKKNPAPETKPAAKPNGSPQAINKEQQKRTKKLEKQAVEAEAKVAGLEAHISQMTEQLSHTDPSDWKSFQEKTQAIKQAEEELMYAMHDWEAAQLALDEENKTSSYNRA
jgi:ATP-binding cassette subfamily F protein 3